jgi:hypothetical protein
MGSIVIQVRKGAVPMMSNIRSVVLSGELRRRAIAGRVPLTQIEAQLGRDILQDRSLQSPAAEIEVFRSVRDDAVMDAMVTNSIALSDLCRHGRGEEINKAGMLWVCQACFTSTVPGEKKKRDKDNPQGPRYRPKTCPGCGIELTEENVVPRFIVEPAAGDSPSADAVAFIDGDDIARRYVTPAARQTIHVDAQGIEFKPKQNYAGPKLLIRQAGVGLLVALDPTDARVPQSVYWYRIKPEWAQAGIEHEYILATLLSRTMTYFVFKRFSEIDPARAHAKLTHKRLENMPIPRVDFADAEQAGLYRDIVFRARRLLSGDSDVGGQDDMQIDVLLRRLWGLHVDDGLYINLVDRPVSCLSHAARTLPVWVQANGRAVRL